jgi:hypothetical protein
MPIRNDLTNQVFGNLTVIGPSRQTPYGTSGRTRTDWRCQCACDGKIVWRQADALIQGQSDSCGCLREKRVLAKIDRAHKAAGAHNRTHGMSQSRLYRRWAAMMDRCYNPASVVFKYYGGRGITVYQPWHKFEGFRDWAFANGYSEDLTLDRIDPNGNYEPSNCRFVTQKQQTRNTRTTVRINSLQTVSEFSEAHEVPYDLVWHTVRLFRDYPNIWTLLVNSLE